MPRADIWKDGIKTRFSYDHQPANRGRKKGRPNRATIYRKAFGFFTLLHCALDQQQRDRRNARRRERYKAKSGVNCDSEKPPEPGESTRGYDLLFT